MGFVQNQSETLDGREALAVLHHIGAAYGVRPSELIRAPISGLAFDAAILSVGRESERNQQTPGPKGSGVSASRSALRDYNERNRPPGAPRTPAEALAMSGDNGLD